MSPDPVDILRSRLRGRAPAPREAGAGADLTEAAVLVPLMEHSDEAVLVFTQRSADLRSHSGQISFPGGKCDAHDRDRAATAKREAWEELGIRPEAVEVIGLLDDVPTPTGFVITPVVGVVSPSPEGFRPNAAEVAEVFEVALARLRDPRALEVLGTIERFGRNWRVYNYRIDGRNIWGATARIVRQLLGLLEG